MFIRITLLLATFLFLSSSCQAPQIADVAKPPLVGEFYEDTTYSIDTYGYKDNGELWTQWDCPDSKFFAPIDLKNWEKTPAVNGRLPTYKETLNGRAILHYGKNNKDVKTCAIRLPKLAYLTDHGESYQLEESTRKLKSQKPLVVVIQMVHRKNDTIVGYRYLSGGVGGALIGKFRFLTEEEVESVLRF